jgi:hypothetical protein
MEFVDGGGKFLEWKEAGWFLFQLRFGWDAVLVF